jgi:hypothetical protein
MSEWFRECEVTAGGIPMLVDEPDFMVSVLL